MIGLALLVSVRALAPFAGKGTPKTPDSFAADDVPPLAIKSDRLVAADDEVLPDKATVKTVPAVSCEGKCRLGRRPEILCEHAGTRPPSPSA